MKNISNKPTVKLITLTSLFAAMTAVLTSFGHIPLGNGYVHMGDSMIYLAACILPFPYSIFAAMIGGALSDALAGYAIYILPTMIIKALITLPYSPKSDIILSKRNALMTIPAGLITVIGYFITGVILFGFNGALASLFGDIAQAVGSGLLFTIFAAGLDRVKFKNNLKLNQLNWQN